MNIGEFWDSNNWDDEPLNEEELEEIIQIHRGHKDAEDIRVRSGGRQPARTCN